MTKPPNDLQDFSRRTRRSFIFGGVSALLGASAWGWILSRDEDQGVPWPLRRVLEANGSLWHRLFNPARETVKPASGKPIRENGDIGIEDEIDLSSWRLHVEGLTLSMDDIRAMPRSEATTEFKCIEGWSQEISYAGVRFSDFLKFLKLSPKGFVSLSTPDDEYYVSIDSESMLHPQTILAYEMNGKPLTQAHGAPLRLIIPVKYGIKSIKRIGKIALEDHRAPDYWAERGYDWFAGL